MPWKPAADADGLAERYLAEISGPRTAFVDGVVLVALSGSHAVGCLVVTAPVHGRSEIKRLWTNPGAVRLSVWKWRTGAIALYERFGFAITESRDERDQLVCMERAV
ncbi:hypothetical protein ACGFY9_24630 [Streptomyces sp. NPDC048504]|uniref:hypothetical protein n=1 Tax=Streptomyces sp. NPDC048504 TaxID=3365559 RepID=UPI00371CAA43